MTEQSEQLPLPIFNGLAVLDLSGSGLLKAASTGEPLDVHDLLGWVQFEADGSEWPRVGRIWAEGPKVGTLRTWWVIPDPRGGADPTDGSCVLVAKAGRRMRVGRRSEGRWEPRGGRYVDKGEFYAESAPQAALKAAQTASPPRPTHAKAPARIPPDALAWFMRYGGGPAGDVLPGMVADVEGADTNPMIPTWYEALALFQQREESRS